METLRTFEVLECLLTQLHGNMKAYLRRMSYLLAKPLFNWS